ncbi:unnamed protein product, partial [Polarella glacialis]
ASSTPADPLQKALGGSDVVVFSTAGCPSCMQTENALLAQGIEFKKVPLPSYQAAIGEATGRGPASHFVWVKGSCVGNGKEVQSMLAAGTFQEMLAA